MGTSQHETTVGSLLIHPHLHADMIETFNLQFRNPSPELQYFQ